jgi:hypothetical protein
MFKSKAKPEVKPEPDPALKIAVDALHQIAHTPTQSKSASRARALKALEQIKDLN